MLRAALLALVFLGTGSAAVAQDAPLREGQRLFDGADGDHALIQTCLQQSGRSCEGVVQEACNAEAAAHGDELTGVFARACDERAIGAWENEMNTALASLRGKLSAHDRQDLDQSQQAWRAATLADIRLAVDSFQGGTGAGLVADQVESRATARRAMFVIEMNESFE